MSLLELLSLMQILFSCVMPIFMNKVTLEGDSIEMEMLAYVTVFPLSDLQVSTLHIFTDQIPNALKNFFMLEFYRLRAKCSSNGDNGVGCSAILNLFVG